MPLEYKYIEQLKAAVHEYAITRRSIMKNCDDALHHSKRAIFALHRGALEDAEHRLGEAERLLQQVYAQSKKEKKIAEEGAYRAALEEYVEATLFFQFIRTGHLGKIRSMFIPAEQYLAGLCDLPGELYRYAIRAATEKHDDVVDQCAAMGEEIIGVLMEFDLTSYLRTKFDQAKQAANKLEEVRYHVSLRQ